MHQEIEIEFKNLLTKDEYDMLIISFNLTEKEKALQTNHYFDTSAMALKENHSALRVRKKGTSYTLTLKQPHEDALLETHQKCSENEFSRAIEEGVLPVGPVLKQINQLLNTRPDTYSYLGELTTERIELKLDEGLLVLDKSSYFNHSDYELEFEVTDRHEGKAAFDQLLHTHSIPKRETKNKIQRFYEEKLRLTKD